MKISTILDKLLKVLPKQKNIPVVGAVVDSLYTSLPVLSILNFLSIITVLYSTIREYLLTWAPWLTFGWFLIVLVILTVVMMLTMYLYVLPSIWTFRNKQMNAYESELLQEVRALRREVKILRSEVKETGGKLNG